MVGRSVRAGRVRTYVIAPLREFLRTEAAGGIVLFAAAVLAIAWANGPFAPSYRSLWEHEIGPGAFHLSLRHWIDDGLMILFFFVVGLEIKRELVTGELRDPRKAALPVIAALGGMAGPAVIYLLLNGGGPYSRGWGVPVATDIAFAVGVLVLLGRRIPSGLKIFLLTLAIADDIGGIVVIAAFYSSDLDVRWLAAAAGSLLTVVALRAAQVSRPLWYVPIGVVVWISAYNSGVHPTIMGVALGLITPAHPVRDRPVLEELEHRLHPITSFAIVPLFALANAGVALDAGALRTALGSTVFWGIAAGLLVGKTLGVSAATFAAVALRVGRLPAGVRARHVFGVSTVAGVGFTVALFITNLAFESGRATEIARAAVLAGSLVSAIVGAAVLASSRPRREPVPSLSVAAPDAI